MNYISVVTANSYFWFFLGSVFLAASVNSMVSALDERFKGVSRWSRHMPAFYFFLSLVVGVMACSVFFINWNMLHFSRTLALFVFVSVFVFFIIFRFFLFFGASLLFFLTGTVFFLNILLGGWQRSDLHEQLLTVRLLSGNKHTYTYEINIPGEGDSFYHSQGERGKIIVYRLRVAPWMFFIPGRDFFLVGGIGGGRKISSSLRFKLLRWTARNSNVFSLERSVFTFPELQLLWLYALEWKSDSLHLVSVPVK